VTAQGWLCKAGFVNFAGSTACTVFRARLRWPSFWFLAAATAYELGRQWRPHMPDRTCRWRCWPLFADVRLVVSNGAGTSALITVCPGSVGQYVLGRVAGRPCALFILLRAPNVEPGLSTQPTDRDGPSITARHVVDRERRPALSPGRCKWSCIWLTADVCGPPPPPP